MTPQRVEDTKIATAEDLSGHMNKDYTFPNVRAMGGKMRPADDNWQLKEPVVIQDISADSHGSWVNGVMTPNEVHGFPFKVREV
jgi:hypothetical protein